MGLDIVYTEQYFGNARDNVLRQLIAFSEERAAEPMAARPFALLLKEPSGEIVGGLWGRTAWHWLHTDLLFVPPSLRRQGHGAALVGRAEKEAAARDCRGAWVDTFSFQARGFYERLGYRVVGTIEDQPPGHSRHFLTKSFARSMEKATLPSLVT